ncbi:MAG: APC family permease [Myxococcota bacterium]|nr:APC family permease [Myxococcota bacterium]MDP7075055.1 APC family permease [Myxococcota bacterium]MDP7299884.1 APC family permease [Myxococcota bacterium]MDP7432498.1 APC family permease [Myxococcota bacterium]HJO24517.1 APC family permease [Myxococcota bacterium]
MKESRIGTFSALSIGIGGMVGGGIFAVTGLTVELTRGAAPLAFVVAGVVALLTAFSYWRLSLRYPSEGGTVEFLNIAFGTGLFTGALNILLCLSYVILLAVYAYAFGAYGASFFSEADYSFWKHMLLSLVIVLLAVINWFGADIAIRSENFFNVLKLILLGIFVVIGLSTPMEWSHLSPDTWVGPFELVAGSMVIFLNYEGFELIANASNSMRNPRKSLPIAYLGGVSAVIVIYVLIAIVVVGHLDFKVIAADSDATLSLAAQSFMGSGGAAMIAIAAMLATSSAINATFYGSGRLTYLIAKTGELPTELERDFHGQPLEGMLIFAGLTLIVANSVPLAAIATMGSAGFLLIFLAVNVANYKQRHETGGGWWVSLLGVLACLIALGALVGQTVTTAGQAWQVFVLLGMVVVSLVVEWVYRAKTGRAVTLRHYTLKNRGRPSQETSTS